MAVAAQGKDKLADSPVPAYLDAAMPLRMVPQVCRSLRRVA